MVVSLIGTGIEIGVYTNYLCEECQNKETTGTTETTATITKWEEITFTHINEIVKEIRDFNGKVLL
ncbi:hypothetical protein ES705_17057 [subsurface metagenome]